jgi:hypothetical protein
MRTVAVPARNRNGAFLPPTLLSVILSAIARSITREILEQTPRLQLLRDLAVQAEAASSWHQLFEHASRRSHEGDEKLLALAAALGLCEMEILAAALASAVEHDIEIAELVATLQRPLAGSRPTVGLVTRALGKENHAAESFASIVSGRAVATGLLVLSDSSVPYPERTLRVPLPLVLAIQGKQCDWPGSRAGLTGKDRIPLGASAEAMLRQQARALLHSSERRLVVRGGSLQETQSAAAVFANELHLTPLFLSSTDEPGLGAWLHVREALPVHMLSLAPGERRHFPDIPGFDGPALALLGPDGELDSPSGSVINCALQTPSQQERESLWSMHIGDHEVAQEFAAGYRLRAGRIADLTRLARHHASVENRSAISAEDVFIAARSGEATGLGSLAEFVGAEIADEALIVPPALRRELEMLCFRCRARETLADNLGISIRSRYRPGVLALFFGPSGTGKTLAVLWLASRLRLPLYRVDLAAVTSKYVGETERNLSHLLTCAEQAGVVLLFDEADSMFGRRTEVRDSNDRFANAQTNYLLQRMEHFDGIAVLTSNGRSRIDSSFFRRLETIIEFQLPDPSQRRALWYSHLGTAHSLTEADINNLALSADLTGGDIRNVALAAAIYARSRQSPIGLPHVMTALESEYRKLGRHLPDGLSRTHSLTLV